MIHTKRKPPPFLRQRFLLDLIDNLESILTQDLMRLCFLQDETSEHYHFVPTPDGPHSFTLENDLAWLEKRGFIVINDEQIKPQREVQYVKEGAHYLPQARGEALFELVIQRETYKKFNVKSVDASNLLATIGYEGQSIDGFMTTLLKNGIRVLCDIRANPRSMKFGFSQKKLEEISNLLGMIYAHIPQLGIEAKTRKLYLGDGKNHYKALFDDYRKHLNDKVPYLDTLYELLIKHKRLAIVCFEKDPQMCHRSIVSNYVSETHQIKTIDL